MMHNLKFRVALVIALALALGVHAANGAGLKHLKQHGHDHKHQHSHSAEGGRGASTTHHAEPIAKAGSHDQQHVSNSNVGGGSGATTAKPHAEASTKASTRASAKAVISRDQPHKPAKAMAKAASFSHDPTAKERGGEHDVCPLAKAQKSLSFTRKQFHMSCEPLVIWELAQLTKPSAKHFLEAGANLGYYGSRVFALWSPGTGLKPTTLQPHLQEEWKGSNSWSTCHDGTQSSDPAPLLCGDLDLGQGRLLPPDLTGLEPQCSAARPEIEYHAFDGSAAFAKNVSALVHKWWPDTKFHYNVAAVMQIAGGTMSFAQRLDEGGHILASHGPSGKAKKQGRKLLEGGGLRQESLRKEAEDADEVEAATEAAAEAGEESPSEGSSGLSRRLTSFPQLEVPIITVDSYAHEKGLELDLLKVDVEGFDTAVLAGAVEQLEKHVWFLQFEWGAQKWRPPSDQPAGPGGFNFTSYGASVEALDYLGFTCYLMGDRYGTGRILLQLTGCMKHEGFCAAFGENCPYLPKESWVNGSPPAATKLQPGADGWGKSGDAVCAHRTRNPAFAWALHYAEKHELSMVGDSRKKLHTDPVMLRQLLSELKGRNKDSLHFA